MPPLQLPRYVQRIRTRHGKDIFYWQAGRGTAHASKRHRLPDDPHSPEFWQMIRSLEGEPNEIPGSFAALFVEYQQSPEFAELAKATQDDYRHYLVKLKPALGETLVKEFRTRHGHELRDKYRDTPTTANHIIAICQSAVAWGMGRDYADTNVFKGVRRLKVKTDGYDPWPQWALDTVWDHGPPDMIMSVALGFYAGQRRADVIRLGREDLYENQGRHWLPVRQQKTGKGLEVPVHQSLLPLLLKVEAGPFVRGNGNGYKNGDSFAAAWSRWMRSDNRLGEIRKAGLVFHGLRKNAVNALLEAGAEDDDVRAVTGHSKNMLAHYSKKVDQRRLAARAIERWEADL